MEPVVPVWHFRHQLANTNVKISPHLPHLVALSSAQNFAIVGEGSAHILSAQSGQLLQVSVLPQKDAVFDMSWLQNDPHTVLVGTGSGSIIVWNYLKGPMARLETAKEVQSLQCNYKNPLFLATGMDGSLRVGDLLKNQFVFAFQAHVGIAYQGAWSPHHQTMLSTVGVDGRLKLWDCNATKKMIADFPAHEGQILCCDFNKYDDIIVTGSNDRSCRIWDLRNLKLPLNVLLGHRYPVRRVKFSPFLKSVLISGSYDMTAKVYNLQEPSPEVITHGQHSEFVTGIDMSLHEERRLITTSWDGRVISWDIFKPMPIIT